MLVRVNTALETLEGVPDWREDDSIRGEGQDLRTFAGRTRSIERFRWNRHKNPGAASRGAGDNELPVQEPDALFDACEAYPSAPFHGRADPAVLVGDAELQLISFEGQAHLGCHASRMLCDIHQAFLQYAVQAFGNLWRGIQIRSGDVKNSINVPGPLELRALGSHCADEAQ